MARRRFLAVFAALSVPAGAPFASLAGLQETAQIEGVDLVACKMTVDMMEIDESKLIEGILEWTAEEFLKYAKTCKICLFT
jgi:peroxiredoxin family protein